MKTTLITLFSVLLLVSCAKEKQAAAPPQKFEVIELKSQNVPLFREFVGQIYGKSDIPIRARVDGFLEGIHFKEGNEIKKGQLLYTIDQDPYKQEVAAEQSRLAQAKTNLSQKESDYERIKPLAEIDAISKRELDMAVAERDAARSEVKSAQANLKLAKINLGYAKVYSPLTGLIGKTMAREGEYVGKSPNPVILNTVSNIDSIRVQFFLSENEYLAIAREYIQSRKDSVQVSRNDDDRIPVQLIFSDRTVYDHNGKIDFIDRNVDPNTGSILLQASFPNPKHLIRPGQFGRVKINIDEAENAILVPQKCVIELQGKYSVLVVNKENTIEQRRVELRKTIDDYWLVGSGLESGEKIILEGVQKARNGMVIVPEIVEYKSRTESADDTKEETPKDK